MYATKAQAINIPVHDHLLDFVTGRDKGPGCADTPMYEEWLLHLHNMVVLYYQDASSVASIL